MFSYQHHPVLFCASQNDHREFPKKICDSDSVGAPALWAPIQWYYLNFKKPTFLRLLPQKWTTNNVVSKVFKKLIKNQCSHISTIQFFLGESE